jgi:hypothetical protein
VIFKLCPIGIKIFRIRPGQLWGPPSLLQNRYQVFFTVVQCLRHDGKHPTPSTAKVKERVALYLYSSSMCYGSLWGKPSPYLVFFHTISIYVMYAVSYIMLFIVHQARKYCNCKHINASNNTSFSNTCTLCSSFKVTVLYETTSKITVEPSLQLSVFIKHKIFTCFLSIS